jgi:hypothetical protein
MKIQMRTTIANANITAVSGSIVELAEKEAKALIAAGFADAVKEKPKPQIQLAKNENTGNTGDVDFSKYSPEQLALFAKKANLDPKIKDPQIIIKKLIDINFDPEAK